MEPTLALLHTAFLFMHAIAFAFAIVTVLNEDLAMLKARRLDTDRLESVGQSIASILWLLWFTGAGIIVSGGLGNATELLQKPKLQAKLTVLAVLTVNGIALHAVVFPLLVQKQSVSSLAVLLASVTGAISTTSWVYAAFVGIARPLADMMTYIDFMSLYVVALTTGIAVAVIVVRPRLKVLLDPSLGAGPDTAPTVRCAAPSAMATRR